VSHVHVAREEKSCTRFHVPDGSRRKKAYFGSGHAVDDALNVI
jgi:hypothetical protein